MKRRLLLSTALLSTWSGQALSFQRASSKQTALMWYNPGWLYRKSITIDHTKVSSGGETYVNFPVLVSLASDADLAAHAQADGDDILFTLSDGRTKLNHELGSYTTATGALIAWVQVTGLSTSVDTVLYMYYGNATVSAQQVAAYAWDRNYKGVYHLSSTDTPYTMTRFAGNPVIAASSHAWQDSQAFDSCVIVDPNNSSQLIMFYTGMAAPRTFGIESIGRATAPVSNPTTWTQYASNPIINDTNRRMDSIVYTGGTFYLYSTNGDGAGTSIQLLTSTDGFTFTLVGSVLTAAGQGRNDGDAVSQGAVIVEAGLWTMLYSWRDTGSGQVLKGYKYATSSDGITWTKGGGTPGIIIPIGVPGTIDSLYMEFKQLIKIGSTYIVAHESYDGVIAQGGMAYSQSLTGGWKKVGDPFFQQSKVPGSFDEHHIGGECWFEAAGAWYLAYCGADLVDPYPSQWSIGIAALSGPTGTPLDIVNAGIVDSTANANHLGGQDMTHTAGKVGGAFSFDGISSHATSIVSATTAVSGYTIQAWVTPSSLSQACYVVDNGLDNSATGSGFGFGMSDGSGGAGAKLIGIAPTVGYMDSGYSFASTSTPVSVAMVNSGGTTKFYVNGAQTANTSALSPAAPLQNLSIGSATGVYNFAGVIDEVRISNVARSVDWLATEFANQNAPSSFYSIGAETTA